MPRYWRDPDTGDVIRANADAPADPGDVVVMPAADLGRLRYAWDILQRPCFVVTDSAGRSHWYSHDEAKGIIDGILKEAGHVG